MLPEVFECPDCRRQFVLDLALGSEETSIHCPQCRRYLGEKDLTYILRSEIDGLRERLAFEKERFEQDAASYASAPEEAPIDAELRHYGAELPKVIEILERAIRRLEHLHASYG